MNHARKIVLFAMLLAFATSASGCKEKVARPVPPSEPAKTEEEIMTERLQAFLAEYLPEAKRLELAENTAYWDAYTTGKDEAYAAAEKAELERRKYHSDAAMFKRIKEIYDAAVIKDPLLARQVILIHNGYAGNQVPAELLEKMVAISTDVQKVFNQHRAKVGDKEYDRNAVKQVLRTSTDLKLRQDVWIAHKAIGAAVAPKVLELVKVRNEAARTLGYSDYWQMQMVLQEHDPDKVTAIFADLDEQTRAQYEESKAKVDDILAKRFKIAKEDLRPWHYADPFMQEAPATSKFDLDSLYTGKDLLAIATKYYTSFGLDPASILERSDVFPKPDGKSEHAFCFTLDRDKPDIRILLNITPSDQWMDTTMHELGHGFYDNYYDASLPWRLREPSHILTTEGVAIMFGDMAKNPYWIRQVLEVPENQMPQIEEAAADARILQQLVFARWSLVMFNFEKELYSNPDQDLNKLWWDLVEKYQMVERPDGRNEPDWSTKDHIVSAAVYYHNYVLGQMFKAQLLETIAKQTGKTDPLQVTFIGDKAAGQFLVDKVFKAGSTRHFMDLTKDITGEEFSAAAYGRSFGWGKAEPTPAPPAAITPATAPSKPAAGAAKPPVGG